MLTTLTLSTLLAAAPAAGAQKVRPYDAQHYKIEMRQGENGAFTNTVTITLKPGKVLSELEFDGYDLKIASATIDGEAAEVKELSNVETRTGLVTVKPKKALPAGKDVLVAFTYSITAGLAHEGFFTVTDNESANALPGYYTQFETNRAQRFMPNNDVPSDKATSELLAIVDGRYSVVSGGTKELDEAFTEGGKNLRRVHWKQTQPHSTYLIAVAIAQMESVLVNEEIPSHVWLPPGTKSRAYVVSDTLRGLFNYQVGFTGTKFPWAKLDVVAVPRFYHGGMENASVIFERASLMLVDDRNDQLSRSTIVGLLAHEMAHQYFGDWVTPATWDEIWMSEGFATFLGNLSWDDYNDNDEAEVRRTVSLTQTYFPEEDGPHAHPLVVKGIPTDQAFDATTYTKGANVLAMLDAWVGRAEMKKSLKAYLEKHGGKAVTSDDFFKAVYETTKKEKELKPFKEAWLNKKGYPIITPSSSYSGGKLTVTIRQLPNHPSEKGAFVFKLPIIIRRATEPAYTKEEIITVDKPEVKIEIDVPAAPQWINWNKGFAALAKVNTSAVSEDQWVDAARNDTDPSWRTLAAIQLLGELVANAPKTDNKPTDAAMNAAIDVLTKDPSPYVREAVLNRLANTRFRQLPAELAAPLLGLSKRPTDLNEDPAGYIRVRIAAMGALGRVDSAEGHKYILEQLARRDIDINYVNGFATAAARMSTTNSIAQLRTSLVTQKGRGPTYYRRAVRSLGTGSSVDIIPLMRETMFANPQNNELQRAVVEALPGNHELRETREFAALTRDVVLDEKTFSPQFRSRFLGFLDDVKYENARLALDEILAGTKDDTIKSAATRTRNANFPEVAAPATEKTPAKGKKK